MKGDVKCYWMFAHERDSHISLLLLVHGAAVLTLHLRLTMNT